MDKNTRTGVWAAIKTGLPFPERRYEMQLTQNTILTVQENAAKPNGKTEYTVAIARCLRWQSGKTESIDVWSSFIEADCDENAKSEAVSTAMTKFNNQFANDSIVIIRQALQNITLRRTLPVIGNGAELDEQLEPHLYIQTASGGRLDIRHANRAVYRLAIGLPISKQSPALGLIPEEYHFIPKADRDEVFIQGDPALEYVNSLLARLQEIEEKYPGHCGKN